jgi:hypothetical protein
MQELDGPLPGKASSLGVMLGAILLEEPMCGPGIVLATWVIRSEIERQRKLSPFLLFEIYSSDG